MIETQRWDDSLIGNPENYGYTKYFMVDGKIYYANISSVVYPTETMIFPCDGDGEPDFGTELYVAYHDEPKESYLLEDIANFLMEMGVKV